MLNTFCRKNNDIKQIPIVIIGVAIHPNSIFNVMPQLTPLPPLSKPNPKIAPITACVLETGTRGKVGKPCDCKKICNPFDENKNNVNA